VVKNLKKIILNDILHVSILVKYGDYDDLLIRTVLTRVINKIIS